MTRALERVVTAADTARALGSGSLEVLATPRLIAWCEQATCEEAEPLLGAGESTVGTRVAVDHLAASAVGARVAVIARLSARQGRSLTFAVEATDAAGTVLLRGAVERVIVDVERFLGRVG